jgi:long-chain acyl-CoA synthetase
MTNFAQELANAAIDSFERSAIRRDGHTLTYGELNAAVARASGKLRDLGVEPGDRVGLQLPNDPTFPILYQAVLRLGAVAVPMNPLLKKDEVASHLIDAGARLIFAWNDFSPHAVAGSAIAKARCILVEPRNFEADVVGIAPVFAIADRNNEDPAVIIYTSGTSGTPKAATLTHSNIRAAAQVGRDLVGAGHDDVVVAALPLFHVFGMNVIMNTTLLARGLMTLVFRFDPTTVLEVIQRDEATLFGGVPTMYNALLNHPNRETYDVASLRLCVSGGSSLPVDVLQRFDTAFETAILEGYGLSETTGMASFNTRDRIRKPGSIGVPVGGTEFRIVDNSDMEVAQGTPGEIVLRGPFVMAGYWNRPDDTAEATSNGWFHMGDIATEDSDGFFFIVDRKKDIIIRGGYNVYPREIEEVLYTHPEIAEVAVVGVPHEELGEEVGAVVVLRPGASVTQDDVRDFASTKLAAFKYPRLVWFTDELPKGPTGKILKREIVRPNSST